MSIGFCPHCKHKIRLDDHVKIGNLVSCWYCGASLKVVAPLQKRMPEKRKATRIWRRRAP